MPDTYKTFLSPGSCQLEVTDLVAAANDDKGVDLYGVAWEIEQVLIAGEGFAASPTDVWVNERGILNVGKSLFDKINRTTEDNDNIPGQCTVVVKATSLIDSSKVARLKVLVGYPGEGGGGGGGGLNIGNLVEIWLDSEAPVIGQEAIGNYFVKVISATDFDSPTIIANAGAPQFIAYAASGLYVKNGEHGMGNSATPTFYDVTINDDYEYVTAELIDSINPTVTQDTEGYLYAFQVPTMTTDHILVVVGGNPSN